MEFRKETSIIYESPHRILDTLEDMEEHFGDRKISISRELTKIYEETLRGSIGEIRAHFLENRPRGELILVLDGTDEVVDLYENLSIEDHLIMLIEEGYSKKDAIKKISVDRDLPKNLVYKESLNI